MVRLRKFKFTRVLQFNFEDLLAKEVSSIRGEDIVAFAESINANTVVIFARDAWGRAYYNSGIARKHAKLGDRDLLAEVVEAARRRGISVVVMIGHTTNPELYRKHPDWAQRRADGSVIAMDTDPSRAGGPMRWPLMCLNSPFLDHVREEVREVLSYGVDGVFLDSFRYMPDADRACFCKYCRARYREETSEELPEEVDWDSESYRRSFKWRYGVNVRGIRAVYERVKELNPQAIVVYNSHPLGWRGRANRILEMARDYVDVVFAECSEADYQPPGFIAEMVKLSKAASGGKPVWASRNSFHTCLTTALTTPVAIRQGLREAFIAGGYPLYLVFSSSFAQNGAKAASAGVREVFGEIEKLEEYMEGAEPVKYAAVLFSSRSRDWGGRDRPDHVTDSFRGFYYALTWSKVPVTYVCDTVLDRGAIEGFRVLVLANASSMSAEAVRSVEEFVRNGGGVVATYLTSIMDERGWWREEFALSKLMGVKFEGLIKLPWSYVKLLGNHELSSPEGLVLWGDFDKEFVDSRTPREAAYHARVVAESGAEVLGYVVEPLHEFGFEYENGRSPPPAGSTVLSPAIVASGGARCVYFSGQLGRLYWRTGMPDLERLILKSVRWAGGLPPVEVLGRGLLQLEAYRRSGQLIIHLLNLTYERRLIVRGNTAMTRGWASTAESVHPPSAVVPLSDLVVRLRGFEAAKAYSPLTGAKFEVKTSEGHVDVLVPKVEEYEVLVVELA